MSRLVQDKLWEHAWHYFELHSRLRMSVFNFYLIFVGFLTAALVKVLEEGFPYPALGILVGILLMGMSGIFWRLDARTSALIKLSEIALIEWEKGIVQEGSDIIAQKIFSKERDQTNEERIKRPSGYTYSECFRIVFSVFFAVGSIGVLIALQRI